MPAVLGVVVVLLVIVAVLALRSLHSIGPAQVGLVNKRLGRRLRNDDPIAFQGESGYQADLLMPGLRFKLWPVYAVQKHPWVQVPAGEIGVVIAQVGQPLPIGAKSAEYRPELGNFADARTFLAHGGQKGVQRPVLTPGTLLPIHPVAFIVITARAIYGAPIAADLRLAAGASRNQLTPGHFGLSPDLPDHCASSQLH